MSEFIKVRGARQHNLKNINIDIPKNQLVVFTGLSGSGKSSLAFDTIYAEGQRRYVESLSAYARQFLGVMDKPDVDSIEGLSPAISIDQKSTSHNPRSTVGTITEIYDYLRLLFARVGHPHCPNCGREIERQSAEQIVDQILYLARDSSKKQFRLLLLSPVVRGRKGEFNQLFDNLRSKGFTKVRLDQSVYSLNDNLVLIKTNKHNIDVIIDKLTIDFKLLKGSQKLSELKRRLTDAVEQGLKLSEGLIIASIINDASFDFPEKPKNMVDHLYSQKFACPVCNINIPEIEPRSFSFNSPHGACPTCSGIGTLLKVDPDLVINPNLSLTEGGILPFGRMFVNDTWFSRVVLHVGEKYGIDTRKPLKNITEKQKKILYFGTGEEIHEVDGQNRYGRNVTIYETFPGIISELEKRFSETESEFVRAEIEKYMRTEICPTCEGKRLKKEMLGITIDQKSIIDITTLSIDHAFSWFKSLEKDTILSPREKAIGNMILKEIQGRLQFLLSVGLDYLTLDRSATTLAGGEAQRIRLASQIGSGLSGVLYVLDEPSIGLHPRDNNRLITTLKHLKNLGNTVIVVEHDKEMMTSSDYIFDFGPEAGRLGGKIIASGTPKEIIKSNISLTGKYLSGRKRIIQETNMANIPNLPTSQGELKLLGCCQNNLKNINFSIPLGKLVCITGVSGSGKSTLVVETLYHALAQIYNPYHREKPGKFTSIIGTENLRRVVLIDQSPIGRTPRSNPVTYTGIFSYIRELFASTPIAKMKGYGPGRFSFNVASGRCDACSGEGQVKIEMQFLPDVYVECEVCQGKRYNSETLEVFYKDKNIADILNLTAEGALSFFQNIPGLYDKLLTLNQVGLSYIHLGQPAPTLSGGEAQRVKLATELSKRSSRNTIYILDEPTTGLHFADLEKLLHVLKQLIYLGNTVLVIEHNLDVIKNADWIIDLGPEGGEKGGQIIAQGSPSEIIKNTHSYTGQFLKKELSS
ncbi:excinuclease ABC subunit UvrA, partial [Candidatus Gottesmanbacteria bacterium]|nr:excinuclease ABC subunit UvrA [Candidatus Gottesmanbacteria bacterium]